MMSLLPAQPLYLKTKLVFRVSVKYLNFPQDGAFSHSIHLSKYSSAVNSFMFDFSIYFFKTLKIYIYILHFLAITDTKLHLVRHPTRVI